MNLRALEAFCAVYEEGSFTAAARRLGLAQPTVSSHVRSLEEELETTLFDRGPRESQPTRVAHLLHRHARRILDLAGEMTEDLDRFLHGLQGHLQVGASTIPGEYWLPGRIRPFHELYPKIEVAVEIHDTRAVIRRVLDGRVEIGVVGARMEDERLIFRELVADRLVVVAPTGSDWSGRGEVTLDELREAPFVLRERGSGTRHRFEEALGGAGVAPSELRVAAELGSTTAVKEAVKAGLGLSVLSSLAVRSDVEAGLLREIAVPRLGRLERSFLAVTDGERALSPLGEAFLDFLLGQS